MKSCMLVMGDNGFGVNRRSGKRQETCFFKLVTLSNVSLHSFHLKRDS